MIKFSETSHKNGLERLVEGLTGRQSEFIYLTENTRTSEFNQIIQRGKVPIIIPNELMAHHKVYKENADYLEFLVAIQAGRILYNSAAADVNDFQLYWDRLFEQNLIKDSDPVWNIDNFFKTFEHRPHLARTILFAKRLFGF